MQVVLLLRLHACEHNHQIHANADHTTHTQREDVGRKNKPRRKKNKGTLVHPPCDAEPGGWAGRGGVEAKPSSFRERSAGVGRRLLPLFHANLPTASSKAPMLCSTCSCTQTPPAHVSSAPQPRPLFRRRRAGVAYFVRHHHVDSLQDALVETFLFSREAGPGILVLQFGGFHLLVAGQDRRVCLHLDTDDFILEAVDRRGLLLVFLADGLSTAKASEQAPNPPSCCPCPPPPTKTLPSPAESH